jgi:hypothetical protein
MTGSVLLLIGLGLYQTQAHGEIITSPDGSFSKHIQNQAALPQASPAHIGGKSVPPGTITVDGNPQDWFDAGIAELIIDPSGDRTPPGVDMLSLRVTDDGVNVYFLYEFAGPPVDHSFLLMDTDINPGTGCPAGGIGMEYALTFAPSSGYFYIGDARDCIYGPDDFPGALIVAIGGNFIEASVSIATLEILSPGLTEFDITAGNDHCDVARYVLGSAPPIHFPDYFPVDPEGHGIKTFQFTYGLSGQYTSEIIGTETVPYTSGDIPGVKISNFPYGSTGIEYNDGTNVKTLGADDYYVSTDCFLADHPPVWSFSTLTDGMLIDQGVYHLVEKGLLDCEMVDNQKILISIQDVSVLHDNYTNAVIFWWLDTDYSFTALNLYGKDSDLGITLPTVSDTGDNSVTAFGIFASGVGSIAFGEIDAATGSLNYLSELKEISPIQSLSGLVYMPPDAPDLGYSLNEDDLVYFYSFNFVQSLNTDTGGWSVHMPMGWVYFDWPFYYESDPSILWFAYPPESGIGVYHFSTGQWEVLPRIIPS